MATGWVSVSVPAELAQQIDWLMQSKRLGIPSRGAYVADAVREHVARHVRVLADMMQLEGRELPPDLRALLKQPQ